MNLNFLQDLILKQRYCHGKESTWNEVAQRVCRHVSKAENGHRDTICQEFLSVVEPMYFVPGGRILYGSEHKNPQLLNCFVVQPDDTRESIAQMLSDVYIISTAFGGVGIDFSKIRPKGAKLQGNIGLAPGSISNMRMVDEIGGQVKAGGARRAALMATLSVNHPDILEFLDVKLNLAELNNFNISILIDDDFINAVKKNKEWIFVFQGQKWFTYEVERKSELGDDKILVCAPSLEQLDKILQFHHKKHYLDEFVLPADYKPFMAADLWKRLLTNAVNCGEPGIINMSMVQRHTNTSYFQTIVSTNPCVSGESIVQTTDGPMKVKDLVGISHAQIINGKVTHTDERGFYYTGYKRLYKIETSSGHSLRLTMNHRVILSSGEVIRVDELLPGDELILNTDTPTYTKVQSITKDKKEHVYDATTDTHRLCIDGFVVHNCSELPLPRYGSCCLGSVNLGHPDMVINGDVNWKLLKKTVKTGIRFLDNVLSVNQYPLNSIKEESRQSRRIGLGILGLHYMLIRLNMKYGSEKSIKFIDRLFNTIKHEAYIASAYLSREKTSFAAFDVDKFLEQGFAQTLNPYVRGLIRKYGIRNAIMLMVAPSGTTSLVAGVSSGLEPIFAPIYKRRWREGSSNITREELVMDKLLAEYILSGKDVSHFVGAYDVTPEQHIQVQATIQRHIDSSLSKTTNVPKNYKINTQTMKVILDYISEVKGFTFYKQGSRENEPLTPVNLNKVPKKELIKLAEKCIGVESGGCTKDSCTL